MTWPASKPLSETNLTDLENRISAAEASVSTGKTNIYNALVAKIATPVSQAFADLVAVITAITRKTAQTYNPSTSVQTIAAGQYLAGTQTIAATTGTATTANVLATKTFNSASGIGQTGAMPNRAGDTACLSSSVSGTTLKLLASNGYRDGVDDNVTITDANFVTGNLRGTVLGLTGTCKRWASGTASSLVATPGDGYDYEYITVSGLNFTPSTIVVRGKSYLEGLFNGVYYYLDWSVTTGWNIRSGSGSYRSVSSGAFSVLVSSGAAGYSNANAGESISWIAFE